MGKTPLVRIKEPKKEVKNGRKAGKGKKVSFFDRPAQPQQGYDPLWKGDAQYRVPQHE